MNHYLATASLGLALSLVSCGKKESTEATGTDAAVANGTYILASNDPLPSVGKTRTVSQMMEMNEAALSVSMGDNQMTGVMNQQSESVEKREPVSTNKLRHLIVSETGKGTITMEGAKQPAPQKTNPLVGIPVILEVKEGKLTASLEEGVPTEEQQAKLDKILKQYDAQEDLVVYGNEPRKPGDRWNVDPSKLSNFAGGTGLSGTFTMEFISVGEINGVNCAKLECVFDLSGKTITEGEEPAMGIAIKGKADIARSIEHLVDLDVKIDGTVAVEGSPSAGVKMKVEGPIRLLQTTELE